MMDNKYIDYQSIYLLRNKYLESSDVTDLVLLLESCFYLEDFILMDKISDLVYLKHETYLREIKSLNYILYSLLAFMANDDYYKALSFLNKCEILKTPELKCYRERDGANYTNLLQTSEDIQLVLIICLFLDQNIDIFNISSEVKKEKISIQYFELISHLFELGYSMQIINKLTEFGHIIYNI